MKFSAILSILSSWHELDDEKRSMMVGRLKALQRSNWPRGVNVGKGQRVDYDKDQFSAIFFVMEFVSMGFTPMRATEIYDLNSQKLLDALEHGGPTDITAPPVLGNADEGWDIILYVPKLSELINQAGLPSPST